MTKSEFLKWLEQYGWTDHIQQVIEMRMWTDAELDRLKESLLKSGRLRMKNKYRQRKAASWG